MTSVVKAYNKVASRPRLFQQMVAIVQPFSVMRRRSFYRGFEINTFHDEGAPSKATKWYYAVYKRHCDRLDRSIMRRIVTNLSLGEDYGIKILGVVVPFHWYLAPFDVPCVDSSLDPPVFYRCSVRPDFESVEEINEFIQNQIDTYYEFKALQIRKRQHKEVIL